MWITRIAKALKFIIKYAPAVVEVVKEARKRHPEKHVEDAQQ